MRQFGAPRAMCSTGLAVQQQEREQTGRKRSSYAALCRMLTQWRNDPETAWRAEEQIWLLMCLDHPEPALI